MSSHRSYAAPSPALIRRRTGVVIIEFLSDMTEMPSCHRVPPRQTSGLAVIANIISTSALAYTVFPSRCIAISFCLVRDLVEREAGWLDAGSRAMTELWRQRFTPRRALERIFSG